MSPRRREAAVAAVSPRSRSRSRSPVRSLLRSLSHSLSRRRGRARDDTPAPPVLPGVWRDASAPLPSPSSSPSPSRKRAATLESCNADADGGVAADRGGGGGDANNSAVLGTLRAGLTTLLGSRAVAAPVSPRHAATAPSSPVATQRRLQRTTSDKLVQRVQLDVRKVARIELTLVASFASGESRSNLDTHLQGRHVVSLHHYESVVRTLQRRDACESYDTLEYEQCLVCTPAAGVSDEATRRAALREWNDLLLTTYATPVAFRVASDVWIRSWARRRRWTDTEVRAGADADVDAVRDAQLGGAWCDVAAGEASPRSSARIGGDGDGGLRALCAGRVSRGAAASQHDVLHRYVVVGETSCGKTAFVRRLADARFIEASAATIGVDMSIVTIALRERRIKVQIFDTAGQERFHALTRSYYRNAMAAFIVYDVTSHRSFKHVAYWVSEARQHATPRIVLVLVGAKHDLCHFREVPRAEAEAYARREGMLFFESSALYGRNVERAVREVARLVQFEYYEDDCSGSYDFMRATNVEAERWRERERTLGAMQTIRLDAADDDGGGGGGGDVSSSGARDAAQRALDGGAVEGGARRRRRKECVC